MLRPGLVRYELGTLRDAKTCSGVVRAGNVEGCYDLFWCGTSWGH